MYLLQIAISAESQYVKNIPAGAGIAEKCHAPTASVIVGSTTPPIGTDAMELIGMSRRHGITQRGSDGQATMVCFMP